MLRVNVEAEGKQLVDRHTHDAGSSRYKDEYAGSNQQAPGGHVRTGP